MKALLGDFMNRVDEINAQIAKLGAEQVFIEEILEEGVLKTHKILIK